MAIPDAQWSLAIMGTAEDAKVALTVKGLTYRFRTSDSFQKLLNGRADLVAVRLSTGKGVRLKWSGSNTLQARLAVGANYKAAYGGTLPLFTFRIVSAASAKASLRGSSAHSAAGRLARDLKREYRGRALSAVPSGLRRHIR